MSSSAQIVPLSNDPNQSFVLNLAVNGGVLTLNGKLHYNEVAQYWTLDLFDVNNNPILLAVPFVTGNSPAGNILGQFGYLNIGSAFILDASGVIDPDFPNNTDLGTDFVLLWDNNQA